MKSIWRNQEGIAYLEFALSIPLLLALLMGGVEITRYVLITQKVEKVSVTISDIVAQQSEISVSSLNQLIQAAGEVMKPYSFDSNAYVVVSSVTKTGTNSPVVNWQYTGGGTWTQASQIGITGSTATLPGQFIIRDRENIIIAEVFYRYQPMLGTSVVSPTMLYKFALFKPRLGDLSTLRP